MNLRTPATHFYTQKLWHAVAALAIGASLSVGQVLHADTRWPEKADGAAAAGFATETIAQLDTAMEKLVEDQDVAGIIWLLAKDGKVATFETAGMGSIEDKLQSQPLRLLAWAPLKTSCPWSRMPCFAFTP